MAKTPKFVRLSVGAQHGCQVDMASGWGITGRDVRQVPDNEGVRTYVRKQIQRGVFEESSQAEWDEVHEGDLEDDDDTPRVVMVAERAIPENKLRHRIAKINSAKASAKAEAEAGGSSDPDDDSPGAMSVAQLKEELASMDLPTTGNKSDLVERLTEALDAEEAGDGS